MSSYDFSFKGFRQRFRDPQEPENMRLMAATYWHALLVLVLSLALLAGAYGLWQLSGIVSGFAAVDAASGPSARIDPTGAALEAANAGFAERQTNYDALKAQPLTVSDPSQ